jgi:large subunit ribosomal protein L3
MVQVLTPGRVFPGKKMAGRMGGTQTTVQGLEVIDIDNNENLLVVKGSVPGKTGNLVSVKINS